MCLRLDCGQCWVLSLYGHQYLDQNVLDLLVCSSCKGLDLVGLLHRRCTCRLGCRIYTHLKKYKLNCISYSKMNSFLMNNQLPCEGFGCVSNLLESSFGAFLGERTSCDENVDKEEEVLEDLDDDELLWTSALH